jgi:drug/metabolite transporter (DMT)-like permease
MCMKRTLGTVPPPYQPRMARPPYPHKGRVLAFAGSAVVLIAAVVIAGNTGFGGSGKLAFIPGAVVIIAAAALYCVPSIIAWRRDMPGRDSVIVVNLLLGWTLIGWAVALAMAVRDRPRRQHGF